MNTTCLDVLARLEDLGVKALIPTEAHVGQRELVVPIRDILAYSADPVGYLSGYFGVTRAQYLDWHASGFSVRCAALSRSGRQCKHIVARGHHVPIERWIALQCEYCQVHSENN